MTTEQMEKALGEAILGGLEHARLTVKEACVLMEMDEAQFRRGVRAEAQVSLTRLMRLPFLSFWMFFLPNLAFLLARRNVTQVAEDAGLRKAS